MVLRIWGRWVRVVASERPSGGEPALRQMRSRSATRLAMVSSHFFVVMCGVIAWSRNGRPFT